MNREILFRGKTTKNNSWIEGCYLHYPDEIRGEVTVICPPPQNREMRDIVDCYVDPATVGQFTEWEDDNNEKIFDGDILQVDDPQQDEPYTTTVRCEKGTYLVDVLGEDFDTCDIGYAISQIWDMNDCKYTVIGNIHDNPELLEEESK